jgi:hypothetical protein
MCKVNLSHSFIYSAEETGKLAETILILHAAMHTRQWHYTIIQNEPDVSRFLGGWAAENLGYKLAGKRRQLADNVRLENGQKLR